MTGATGRLGCALLDALEAEGVAAVGWSRPEYDLDDPGAAFRMMDSERPDVVVHAAAWTDVDGCAEDPALATRRNADAAGELAAACARKDSRLVLLSTNEVFDGQRSDGRGYAESDQPRPINSYGQTKLVGEQLATEAFHRIGRLDDLLIVRTAWLFGPPGNDFPTKILKAADALPSDEPLKVVDDEVGSPTYSVDLAHAIVQLVADRAQGGTYHLVNEGHASRLELARRVLELCRPGRQTSAISRQDFDRLSTPPAWAVLHSTRPAALVVALRSWQEAIDAYVSSLCPA